MARKLKKWIAYYADGKEYNSDEYKWDNLPQFGFVYLLLLYDDGSQVPFNGMDIFFSHNGILGNDNDRDGILRQLPWVKFGQWVTQQQFDAICEKARVAAVEHHRKYYANQSSTD